MQKYIFFLLLTIPVLHAWCMDGNFSEKSPGYAPAIAQKVTLIRARESQEPVQAITAAQESKKQKTSPLIIKFKIPPTLSAPVSSSSIHQQEKEEPEVEFNFDDDDPWPPLGSSYEKQLEALFAELPSIFPTYYLVHFDDRLKRYLTFCNMDRAYVMRTYLAYLFSDASTAELRERLQNRFPLQLVKQTGQEYSLACIEPMCWHCELQSTVHQTMLNMVMHHLLEHQRESTWYQRIDNRIAESFEEALKKLKGIHA